MTWTITNVEGDAANATAEMVSDFGQGIVTYHWQCTADGLVSYDFGAINIAEFGEVSKFEVSESSGVFLPPADLLTAGYSWSNAYTIQLSFNLQGQQAAGVNQVSNSYQVTGTEPVTVGGEARDGLQMSGTTASNVQISVQGISVPARPVNSAISAVIARGVGFVSRSTTTNGETDTAELVSYQIP
jgi:hypothetical protein